MPKKPNPENMRKFAIIDGLREKNPLLNVAKACREVDVSASSYRSWCNQRRIRNDEALSWGYVGKSTVEEK